MKYYGIDSKNVFKIPEVSSLSEIPSGEESLTRRYFVYNQEDDLLYYGNANGWAVIGDVDVDADRITTGELNVNRIPTDQLEIDAGQVVSGLLFPNRVPLNVITKWGNRSVIFGVEMWSPPLRTMVDDTTVTLTDIGSVGSNTLDINDTTDLVEGREYVIYSSTHREAIEVLSITSSTRFIINGTLSNAYGIGSTIARHSLTGIPDTPLATDGDIYYAGPLYTNNADSTKRVIITRTENDATVSLYVKDTGVNTTWTEYPITASYNTGTVDYEDEYEIITKGYCELKIVCSHGATQEDVNIFQVFLLEPTSLYIISADTNFYVAIDGNDTTGDGTPDNPWATINYALEYLDDYIIMPNRYVTINVGPGHYDCVETVEIFHEQGRQISIKGTTSHEIYLTALTALTASTPADNFVTWTSTFTATDVSNIVTGDYVTIHVVTSPASGMHCFMGCHEVISVDPVLSTVTLSVRHADQTSPTLQACNLSATIYKVILDYTNVVANDRGVKSAFLFSEWQNNTGLRRIEQMAIVGPDSSDTRSNYAVYLHGQSDVWVANLGISNWGRGIFTRDDSSVKFKNANGVVDTTPRDPLALSVACSKCGYGMYHAGTADSGADGNVNTIFSGCKYGLYVTNSTLRMAKYFIGCPSYAASGIYQSLVLLYTSSFEGCSNFAAAMLSSSKGSFMQINSTWVNLGNNIATFSTPAVNTIGNENAYIDT